MKTTYFATELEANLFANALRSFDKDIDVTVTKETEMCTVLGFVDFYYAVKGVY